MSSIAGIVGEPDPVYGAYHVLEEGSGEIQRPKERPDAASPRVECPIVLDTKLEGFQGLWVDLAKIVERMPDPVVFGEHAEGHALMAP